MRSDITKKGVEREPHRDLLRDPDLGDDDFNKPFITIVNSCSETVPREAGALSSLASRTVIPTL